MRRAAALTLVAALTACGPVGSPASNPDHGPPRPPNGDILNPDRPANMPADFLFMSWRILALDEDWEPTVHVPVKIHVEAVSDAPVQGNVHGGYPFDVYAYTPYTHTIWYAPGVHITTSVVAIADPPFGRSGATALLVCVASSTHHIDEAILEHDTFVVNDYCNASWDSLTAED